MSRDSQIRVWSFGVSAGVVSLFLLAVYLMQPARSTPRAASRLAADWPSDNSSRAKEEVDPYSPDCGIIRDYLKRHEGEVEIVSWGKRTIIQNYQGFGGQAILSARWRRVGESGTKSGIFTIGPHDTVENVVMSD